jgi:hypothetical protein
MEQLLLPVEKLRVAGAKREHGVWQGMPVIRPGMHAHQHGAIATAFNFPASDFQHGVFSRTRIAPPAVLKVSLNRPILPVWPGRGTFIVSKEPDKF